MHECAYVDVTARMCAWESTWRRECVQLSERVNACEVWARVHECACAYARVFVFTYAHVRECFCMSTRAIVEKCRKLYKI